MPLFIYIAIFAFGAVVGSFLNVCIYRMPRGESIISPPSHCPSCGDKIHSYDNIPIISYLILKGRCRSCNQAISPVYPTVELLNGICYVIIASIFRPAEAVIYCIFISALIVITFIDLKHWIIPDRITLPGIAVGLVTASTILPVGFKSSIIGAVLGGTLFYLIAVFSGGMGGGDVKLITMIGAFLGWKGMLITIFVGSLIGAVVGISLMIFKGFGRKSPIPFGPFLSLGAIIALFFSDRIVRLYLHLV
ncbi:MAG: prepilin peptidase [Nitrospirota bacterium]